MAFVAWANLYICANVLLASSAALVAVLDFASHRLERPLAYRHCLRLAHVLAVAAVLLAFVPPLVRYDGLVAPRPAQIWSSPTMRGVESGEAAEERAVVAVAPAGVSLPLGAANRAAVVLFLIGLLIQAVRTGADLCATRRIVAGSQELRRYSRSSLRASEHAMVPFSFWRPGRYVIVVPSALALHPRDLRLAIRHEAQHHRQQDTKWLYLYQLLKALFFWNPCVHVLERRMRALQELACDEAVTARGNVEAAEYCRCLLRVAEAAASRRRLQVYASMIGGGAAFALKRRIEAVLVQPERHQRVPVIAGAGAIGLAALAATALTFESTIGDRRVSTEAGEAMVAAARARSAFPVAANDRVLRQLNLLLATPDGRAYVAAGLERMRSFDALISAEIEARGLPRELAAMPLVESGYRNLPPNGPHGAGLWQLIEPTARLLGLKVDDGRDERLDVRAETRAAVRYLADLYRHFGDWNLAILAYNTGSARVEEGIRAVGSRDAWRIIDAGYENDRDYLARVMAAILIVENPSLLE